MRLTHIFTFPLIRARRNNVHWDGLYGLGLTDAASGTLDHFRVIAPTTATTGSDFNLTVIAEDVSGNPVYDYDGTVTLTHSGTAGVADYGMWIQGTFTADDDLHSFLVSDGGVFTFVVRDYAAETFRITAIANGNTGESDDNVQRMRTPTNMAHTTILRSRRAIANTQRI